jgi:hypothetical protein
MVQEKKPVEGKKNKNKKQLFVVTNLLGQSINIRGCWKCRINKIKEHTEVEKERGG